MHLLANKLEYGIDDKLSIPVTWDFSMHRLYFGNSRYMVAWLSIPVTWDFSMHPEHGASRGREIQHFQFPLLGIFLCTNYLN